ncbi:hypothetical protein llap_22144 [Limosa lapponica baueri]|uniref:Ricin B lectin domain-containing protein n=1 Tax=Limosa lapponica baueri TaxID=1758121 RepID=A0A2I0T199_LIMLA|nr:hypothetical protein llap_22144 [Limosa lapponica baueri]
MWIFVYSYTGSDAFTIRHDTLNKCIQVKNSRIVIDDCKETSEALWKWVSQNRLFHLGSKQCLGLDIFTKSLSRLKMVDCNSELMLWWRCADASILGASQYKVTIKSTYVTASINATDQWRSNSSSDDICRFPYHGFEDVFFAGGLYSQIQCMLVACSLLDCQEPAVCFDLVVHLS